MCFKISGVDGFFIEGKSDEDIAESLFQVGDIFGEAKDCHYFGGNGDIESRFSRYAVSGTA